MLSFTVHTLYPVCFQSLGLWGRTEKIDEEEQQEVRWLGSLVLKKLRLEGGAERPLGAGQPLTAASWVNLGQGTAEKDKQHREGEDGWQRREEPGYPDPRPIRGSAPPPVPPTPLLTPRPHKPNQKISLEKHLIDPVQVPEPSPAHVAFPTRISHSNKSKHQWQ